MQRRCVCVCVCVCVSVFVTERERERDTHRGGQRKRYGEYELRRDSLRS